MLSFDPSLLSSFSAFDIFDPAEMDIDSRVTKRFPQGNNANTYKLRNRGLLQAKPSGRLSQLAMRREGDLIIAHAADRFGTEVGTVGDGHARYCLSFMLSGGMEMTGGGQRDAAQAHGNTGFVYRGLPGTRFLTTDGNRRLMVWLEAARLERTLEVRLGESLRAPLTFASVVDWGAGRSAALGRMVAHLVSELGDHDGLVSEPITRESYIDMLAQTMLTRLHHSYSARLERPAASPAPRHLRRAEAFMHASAEQAITLADVAVAAGCSTGTLHAAFRQFRETTPLSALHDVRLRRARAALLEAERDEPIRAIARRFGFSNLSRFATAYDRRFGERPVDTRRLGLRPSDPRMA